jgi:hypothetical protein
MAKLFPQLQMHGIVGHLPRKVSLFLGNVVIDCKVKSVTADNGESKIPCDLQ